MRSACSQAFVRLVLPLLLVPTVGCSSDKDRVEKQLSKLREEVVHLQSETDRMGERLDAMEMRQASVPHYAEERVAQSSATLTRPRLKVVRVEPGGDGSALDADGADGTAADADTGPRVVIQGEGKAVETRTLPASPVAAKTTKADAPKPKAEASKPSKPSKSEAAPAK